MRTFRITGNQTSAASLGVASSGGFSYIGLAAGGMRPAGSAERLAETGVRTQLFTSLYAGRDKYSVENHETEHVTAS